MGEIICPLVEDINIVRKGYDIDKDQYIIQLLKQNTNRYDALISMFVLTYDLESSYIDLSQSKRFTDQETTLNIATYINSKPELKITISDYHNELKIHCHNKRVTEELL
jgi:hypothetical protein